MALKSALVACLCAECAMKFKWAVIAGKGTKKAFVNAKTPD